MGLTDPPPLPRLNRRKGRAPITVDMVAARVEETSAKATKLIKVIGAGLVLVLATGSTLVVIVQDQLDNFRQKGRELQQQVDVSKIRSEGNQERIARLQRELAQASADNDATAAKVDSVADDTANAMDAATEAKAEAKKKKAPVVISKTTRVTEKGRPGPAGPPGKPAPIPSPRPPGPLGLPPLFPDTKE